MITHRRTRAPAAAVREQRQVFAWRKLAELLLHREHAELDEMISAPARAELRPRLVPELLRHRADRPVRVQHVMGAALLEIRAHAEARLRLDGTREPIL